MRPVSGPRGPRPAGMHHFPMGATTEVMGGVGDFYMLGHAMIGDAVEKAGLRSHAGGPLGSFRRRLVNMFYS